MNKVTKINYNNNILGGCKTCDWGSEYISDIEIIFENGDKLEISTNQMYEYVLTESDYMHALYISKNETDLVFNILKIIKEKVNNIETEIELNETEIKVNGKEIEILKTLYSKNREIIYKEAK